MCELLSRGLAKVTDSEHLEMLLEVVASLAENGEHSSFVYVVANQKWLVNMVFFHV